MFFFVGAFLLLYVVLHLRNTYSKFSEYGVGHFKPFPILGNSGGVIMRKTHMANDFKRLYNAFPNDRFVGRYDLMEPTIHLRDPELIKMVLIKDFEYFIDHRTLVDQNVDTLFGRSLFSLKGQEWKDMRATLTPAYTSSKIKAMLPFIKEVNDQMIKMLKNKIQASRVGSIDFDAKDLVSRYTNDVIATCAFGVKIDSHNNQDNKFFRKSKDVTTFGLKRILIYLGYTSFPWIMEKLNIKLYDDKMKQYFGNIIIETMKIREQNNIIRPDMVQLLMEAKKGKLQNDDKSNNDDANFATSDEAENGKAKVHREWSDDDLVAQAFIFFLAGSSTVSSTLTFLLYELALNPEIQDKLFQEIVEHEKNGGILDYNTIKKLRYLDMVICETLRKWPPTVGLDRKCIKNYNLGKPNKKAKRDYYIKNGDHICVPIMCLHYDPKYFPDPDKFDPERFSVENRPKIDPMTYLPFGAGPRYCLGSRFALCEVKLMTYLFFKEFEVTPSEKTKLPITLSPGHFTLVMDSYWLRLSKRK